MSWLRTDCYASYSVPEWSCIGRMAKTSGQLFRIPDVRTGSGRAWPQRGAEIQKTTDSELADLLGAVARGDLAAFDAVYDCVAASVFGVVRGVVRDRSQSEEVTQEVVVEVWRTASRFDPSKGSALAWVTTIAHRRAIDRVRSEQKAAERELRTATAPIAYDDVVDTVEANLDRERVRRCLDGLTELQRESVTLAYYGGYTYRQVAGLLGVPPGTVSTRMRDALIRLRDCLGVGR